MRRAIDKIDRRRKMQYNKEHGITPETIVKAIQKKIVPGQVGDGKKLAAAVEGLAKIANPLISGAGLGRISGKNYLGPRNISEIIVVVESPMSEPGPVIGMGGPPAWYSDQQVAKEPGQPTGFDYNDPEFREVGREIV